MGILKVDVEHEINKELSKSRRKFGCPRIKKIVCDRVKKYGEKHINCRVSILENENIRNSCDMNLVTRELSEDVGESFLKSEFKYMCYVPRRMVCSTPFRPFRLSILFVLPLRWNISEENRGEDGKKDKGRKGRKGEGRKLS